jgi:hypothetical protein
MPAQKSTVHTFNYLTMEGFTTEQAKAFKKKVRPHKDLPVNKKRKRNKPLLQKVGQHA